MRRIGPNRLVANICSTTGTGISSTAPAPASPALCTSPSGTPTVSMIRAMAESIESGSSRSSLTPISLLGS